MKFPKSVHAEGWDSHVGGASSTVKTNSPAFNARRGFKAGAKPVSLHTPLHGAAPAGSAAAPVRVAARTERPPVAAPAAPRATAFAAPAAPQAAASAPPPRSSGMAWAVGAGVGVLLIGGAVVVSRSLSPAPAAVPRTPVVVGQVTPSPQDAQLQSSPPAAGGMATEAASTTPSTLPPAVADEVPAATGQAPAAALAPVSNPPAELPAVKPAPARTAPAPSQPQVWTARPADIAPAPVIRTLTPPPEVLAQASSTAQPTMSAPGAASGEAMAAPVTPPAASAVVPPTVVAQQAPAPAAVPDPADASITVQVRQALAADATLATVPIAVSTDHGIVKLEGQAPDVQARDRATVVAAAAIGVKAVDNRLTLPPVASLDRGAAGNGG